MPPSAISKISFQVQHRHRNVPAEALLADLRRVADLLRQSRLSQTQYTQHGRYTFVTFCRRFGSWKSALARVNLHPAHLMNVSATALLNDIHRVAAKLKTQRLTWNTYTAHGKYSRKVIHRHFGRWQSAAEAARLIPAIQRPRSTLEMFDNLKQLWTHLGHQPRYEDLKPRLSKFGPSTYTYRFGSFTKALAAFAHHMNPNNPAPETQDHSRGFNPKGPRTINVQLRFKILKRDHFRCRACGRSPATHPRISLQVDHITPWSRGGRTTDENLQTLCNDCNRGKSNDPP